MHLDKREGTTAFDDDKTTLWRQEQATRDFVDTLRAYDVRPHVTQNLKRPGGSAIDRRTARHASYEVSQRKRPLIEKAFGWMKQTGGIRKTKLRGLGKIAWQFLMTAAAFNLWRLPKLQATSRLQLVLDREGVKVLDRSLTGPGGRTFFTVARQDAGNFALRRSPRRNGAATRRSGSDAAHSFTGLDVISQRVLGAVNPLRRWKTERLCNA